MEVLDVRGKWLNFFEDFCCTCQVALIVAVELKTEGDLTLRNVEALPS